MNHSVWIALGILALFAALMVGAFTDLERHRRQVDAEHELDDLWADEVGTGWASADRRVATTPAGADAFLGGAA